MYNDFFVIENESSLNEENKGDNLTLFINVIFISLFSGNVLQDKHNHRNIP